MIRVSSPTICYTEQLNVMDAMLNNQLSAGAYVKRFEDMIAEYCGAKYAVACSSGTAALHLALVTLGIKKGDEVIVPDFTFVATANAVRYCGAKVVLADVLMEEWTINPTIVDKKTNWLTAAVIPVHLYGRTANVTHDKTIVEDSCEAFGKKLIGDMAVFSFYGNKVITTGEGGAIITNDKAMYERLKHLRGGAMTTRYNHDEIGFNYRITELQGAVGCAQMSKVDKLLKRRAEIDRIYHENLPGFIFQKGDWKCNWMTAVRVRDRDKVMSVMSDLGVETRPGFVPLHTMPMYKDDSGYPVSEFLGREVLCLPTHANLTDENVEYVSMVLKEACE